MSTLTRATDTLDVLDDMISQRMSEVDAITSTRATYLAPVANTLKAEIEFYGEVADVLQDLVDEVLGLLDQVPPVYAGPVEITSLHDLRALRSGVEVCDPTGDLWVKNSAQRWDCIFSGDAEDRAVHPAPDSSYANWTSDALVSQYGVLTICK